VVGRVQGGDEHLPETLGHVDHNPGAPGPQDIEDADDVARHDRIGFRRPPRRSEDREPVGVRDQEFLDVRVEVVALGFGPEGVRNGHVRTEPERHGHLAELQVEVDQHDLPVGGPGQELGGIGGEEGLSAPARRRTDGEYPSGGRRRRPGAEAAPGDPRGSGQDGGDFSVVRTDGKKVVGAGLDDLYQVGAWTLLERQDHRHPREPLVKRAQAPEPASVHDGGTRHQHVPRRLHEAALGGGYVGAPLHDGSGRHEATEARREIAGAVQHQHANLRRAPGAVIHWKDLRSVQSAA
jgi:hypothetical protein